MACTFLGPPLGLPGLILFGQLPVRALWAIPYAYLFGILPAVFTMLVYPQLARWFAQRIQLSAWLRMLLGALCGAVSASPFLLAKYPLWEAVLAGAFAGAVCALFFGGFRKS